MPPVLAELVGQRRALVSQLNAINDQITAVDGLIGRAHLTPTIESDSKAPKRRVEIHASPVTPRQSRRSYEASLKGYLQQTAAPAHTKTLFDIAIKNGYQTTGRGNPYYIFCATLRCNKRFVRISRGMYYLAEED